jgi:hypothetical protein
MRSILLASAAIILSTGIACAQSATPSPAPNGATSGPIETSPGLSPGKTTPPAAGEAPSTISPAVDTAAPANGTSMGANKDSVTAKTHTVATIHHSYSHEMMPMNGTPAAYLHMAKTAIHEHNKTRADDALSNAETILLTRSVPQSEANPVDHSPAVNSIEGARKAVQANDMTTASSDIDMAMSQIHHARMDHKMSNNGAMGNGMSK